MLDSGLKASYLGCVLLALFTMFWAAPRCWGVQTVASAQAKKDPSVRSGSSHRTHYIYLGGFGGK